MLCTVQVEKLCTSVEMVSRLGRIPGVFNLHQAIHDRHQQQSDFVTLPTFNSTEECSIARSSFATGVSI
jgi:hypothetical protein